MAASPASSLALALLCSSLLFVRLALGSVHTYDNAPFSPFDGDPNAWIFNAGREGMVASTDNAVLHWTTLAKGVANGKSYIRFDGLKLNRPVSVASQFKSYESTGLVQAVVFEVNDRNRVGHHENGKFSFCCSPELANQVGCTKGKIIIKHNSAENEWPRVVNFNFFSNSTEASTINEVRIVKTGMYFVWFVICDEAHKTVTVSGRTTWKNPSGYLPGMMAPLLPFHGWLSLAYFLLGGIWLTQCLRHWKDVLQLQNCITSVIIIGMAEETSWYSDYLNFNAKGFRPIGITIWAVLLGIIRKTLSRLLILVVSMGYGVVRPTLGGLTGKVLLLGGAYFASTTLLDTFKYVGAIDDLNKGEIMFLVTPVAIFDAIFILWIFTSLSKTLSLLQAKRVTHKIELYRKFTNLLALTVLISFGWVIFEMWFKATNKLDEKWQSDWILSSFPQILAFALLCGICVLWSPSQSSTRYAYSEDNADELGEESVGLTSAAATATKEKSEEKPVKKAPVNTDVFSLDDELEEGKRE